jgi:drug/metabolite transporter (DMT)-like permease
MMPLAAVGLVLLSCVLHAFWNLLFKRAGDKLAFMALFLTLTPLLYLPLPILLRREAVPPAGWLCVGATGLLYAGYFLLLAQAYRHGELSVAYPLARGVGPALTFAWGVLFLGERPSAAGAAAVALILGGAFLLHWQGGPGGRLVAAAALLRSPASAAALLVALLYSLYSLTDKIAVGRLRLHPALYIYLTYTTAALLTVPWVIRRSGAAALAAEWRRHRWPCLAVAALNLFAYLLVLYALSLPHTPVSYVAPLRTASVLLGVLFGVRVLREEAGARKVVAALLMMAGIALLAIKG